MSDADSQSLLCCGLKPAAGVRRQGIELGESIWYHNTHTQSRKFFYTKLSNQNNSLREIVLNVEIIRKIALEHYAKSRKLDFFYAKLRKLTKFNAKSRKLANFYAKNRVKTYFLTQYCVNW